MVDGETGISRYSKEMVSRFTEKYGENQITLIVSKKFPQYKCKQLVTSLKPFNIVHWFLFPLILKKCDFDFYLSFQYSSPSWGLEGRKHAAVVHDLMYELVPYFFGGSTIKNFFGRIYYRALVSRSLISANEVFSVSNTTAKDLLKVFGIESHVTGEGACLVKDGGESFDEEDYFLYVGSDRPHKNLNVLLSAYSEYRKEGGRRKLLICGHVGLSKISGVEYLGFVSEKKLSSIYAQAYCLIFPSKYEGFGLPLLEAISLGTPVIASNIPVFQEMKNSNIMLFDADSSSQLCECLWEDFIFNKEDADEMLDKYNWDAAFSNIDRVIIE